MSDWIKEFKEFALKGNVVDMAVGIIIGGAFGTIVKSMVTDVLMPPIGKLLGGVSFSDMAINLGKGADGKDVLLKYGAFIDNVISFLIVAFCVFLLVKGMNHMKAQFEKEEETKEKAPPAPTKTELLLEEIRDALVKKS